MQKPNEKMSLNLFSALVSQNTMIPQGLVSPYEQQARIFQAQNEMTLELYKQFHLLEERAVLTVRSKNKIIREANQKSDELEIRLKKALQEAEFYRKLSDQRTVLCQELSTRLLDVKKKETSRKIMAEIKFAVEAESSTGENGGDVEDTARTRSCKRRRF